MKQQLSKERDKNLKRTNKDVADVRKQLEDIISKNGDLSRTNTDLRHKVTDLDHQVKDHKDKISSQKHHIEHLVKIKKKQEETINSLQVNVKKSDSLLLSRPISAWTFVDQEQVMTITALMSQIET